MKNILHVPILENHKNAKLAFFFLIVLATLSPAINLLLGIGTSTAGEGSATRMTLYAAVFALTLISTVKPKDLESWWPLPSGITVCVMWFSASLVWAINPEIAGRRLVLTIAIIWVTFALLREIEIKPALNIVRIVFGFILLFNYLAVVVAPQIGITDDTYSWLAGAWRGVLAEKNHAGAVTALTILLFLFDAEHIRVSIRAIILFGATCFLYMTTSKTSLGLTLIAVLLGGILHIYNPYYRIIAVASITSCVALLFLLGVEKNAQITMFVNAYMDDPESLTGRVQIWPVLWEYFQNNPLLGAGFGSFWNIGLESPILKSEGWVSEIASGHNGYLDLLVQVGLPGLIIAIFAAFVVPVSKLIWRRLPDTKLSALSGSVLFFCFSHNFTETTFFDRDSIVFIFILISMAAIQVQRSCKPS